MDDTLKTQLNKIRDGIASNRKARPEKRPVVRYYKVHRRRRTRYHSPLDVQIQRKHEKHLKQLFKAPLPNIPSKIPGLDWLWEWFWEDFISIFCQGK